MEEMERILTFLVNYSFVNVNCFKVVWLKNTCILLKEMLTNVLRTFIKKLQFII